ncbi:unnamed protein product [Adineta steineri]|uniref:Limiting CO2-inducible protein B/C beta carbonyic anhydrase domain-containing protein n=1 Tax=Adineta steineri TaxID=433720 RepID=A0A814F840_9BILA|nr:unnamed protein product [Adineta steineri]CAF1196190.1 unnamed protein product [Adineta steineri]
MTSSSSKTRQTNHILTSSRDRPSLISPPIQSNNSGATCSQCHQVIRSNKSGGDAFQSTLQRVFPGAYGLEDFVFQTKQTLVPEGFYPHVNTLVCVGLCRDEITSPLEEAIENMWGQGFICGSLAGMLFCGKTGFAAAHHHAPDNGRFIYYCFTHIAIDHEGSIGSVYRTRSGMHEKTTACGALAAFTAEIAANKLNLDIDESDIEMSMLRRHIVKQTGLSTDPKNAPDLLKVTMAAYKTITSDLERHVREDAKNFKDRQYALFTGVQIHGPNGTDYCWLGKANLLKNGVLTPIVLSENGPLKTPVRSPTKRH